MTKIFILCLVLFPLIFVGVLVATGTLADLTPSVREEIAKKLTGKDPVVMAAASTDEIDSLLTKALTEREAATKRALDSLSVMQGRLETERRELERFREEIEGMAGSVDSLRGSMQAAREKERKSIASIVGQMEPERAADLLAMLDASSREFLVRSMKTRQAAEVLGLLPVEVAAPLVEAALDQRDEEQVAER
jgi:flagellar motility protein MotE (MotC chaperone)